MHVRFGTPCIFRRHWNIYQIYFSEYIILIKKIYAKYISIIQLFAQINFIYFVIYFTYIFFHMGHNNNAEKLLKNWNKEDPINEHVKFLFFVLNDIVKFSKYIRIFSRIFLHYWRKCFRKKSKAIKSEIVSSITRKILECDMKSC